MKPIYKIIALVVAGAFAAGAAIAQTSSAVQQDKAQLKADQAGLASEKTQLKTDEKARKADAKAGKNSILLLINRGGDMTYVGLKLN